MVQPYFLKNYYCFSYLIMKNKLVGLFAIFLVIISCKPAADTNVQAASSEEDTLNLQEEKDISSIGETLSPDSKKQVAAWPEYKQLDDLISNFYSISPSEALNLSKELASATSQLKDSIKIERYKQPDIAIRINVLHNYALRLADMATLEYIEPSEVKVETQNILQAFSALNSKLNNIYDQKKLEAELKSFSDQ